MQSPGHFCHQASGHVRALSFNFKNENPTYFLGKAHFGSPMTSGTFLTQSYNGLKKNLFNQTLSKWMKFSFLIFFSPIKMTVARKGVSRNIQFLKIEISLIAVHRNFFRKNLNRIICQIKFLSKISKLIENFHHKFQNFFEKILSSKFWNLSWRLIIVCPNAFVPKWISLGLFFISNTRSLGRFTNAYFSTTTKFGISFK